MDLSGVKAVWKFLWEEDSFLSWLANVVIAFILIKFVVYPLIGLILGTSFPIVAVISGSMEHDGNFDQYWTTPNCQSKDGGMISQENLYLNLNISRDMFQQFRFTNGFNKGDIMILQGIGYPKIGDVIVFIASTGDPVIHRVVRVRNDNKGFVVRTKGDHNCGTAYFEESIEQRNTVGKAFIKIPFLGWVKILFVDLLKLVGLG